MTNINGRQSKKVRIKNFKNQDRGTMSNSLSTRTRLFSKKEARAAISQSVSRLLRRKKTRMKRILILRVRKIAYLIIAHLH